MNENKWISIEDELPPPFKTVIVMLNDGTIATCFMDNNKNWLHSVRGPELRSFGVHQSSYWMHLPDKPVLNKPKRTVKMAQALIFIGQHSGYSLTSDLFESEAQAREKLSKYFVKFPASDWIEIEVEDE